MAVRALIDTSVWLDVAKDHRQHGNLHVLEELVRNKLMSLIVPRTVVDEFARNKDRVIEENSRSAATTLKRATDFIAQFGDPKRKRTVLRILHDVDYQRPAVEHGAKSVVNRIETLFGRFTTVEASDTVKLRAAQRAIERTAPFHRQRNGIDDAILIETYRHEVSAGKAGERFAFITHNTKDFSHPTDDNRKPHPDLANCFSKIRSRYYITLGEALKSVRPKGIADVFIEDEYREEPRRLDEILEAIDELITKIWYDHHQVSRYKIEIGKEKLVDKLPSVPWPRRKNLIQRNVWEGAVEAAAKVEKRFGVDNLGPWSKFDWGMMNGKLSALRWVLGDEWDMLDT
jgi:hypothetical protein